MEEFSRNVILLCVVEKMLSQSKTKNGECFEMVELAIGRMRAWSFPTFQCWYNYSAVPKEGNKYYFTLRKSPRLFPHHTGCSTDTTVTAASVLGHWIGLGPEFVPRTQTNSEKYTWITLTRSRVSLMRRMLIYRTYQKLLKTFIPRETHMGKRKQLVSPKSICFPTLLVPFQGSHW